MDIPSVTITETPYVLAVVGLFIILKRIFNCKHQAPQWPEGFFPPEV
jgi:hypothetical protein